MQHQLNVARTSPGSRQNSRAKASTPPADAPMTITSRLISSTLSAGARGRSRSAIPNLWVPRPARCPALRIMVAVEPKRLPGTMAVHLL